MDLIAEWIDTEISKPKRTVEIIKHEEQEKMGGKTGPQRPV